MVFYLGMGNNGRRDQVQKREGNVMSSLTQWAYNHLFDHRCDLGIPFGRDKIDWGNKPWGLCRSLGKKSEKSLISLQKEKIHIVNNCLRTLKGVLFVKRPSCDVMQTVKAMDTEVAIIIIKLQKQQQSTVRLSRRESNTKGGWTAEREK